MGGDGRKTPVSIKARLGRERVPKVTTKAHTAQRFLVNILPKARALEGTSADSHTRVRIPSLVARATKARSRAAREIGARSVEKTRIRHTGQNRVQRILPLLRKLC